eukprot:836894-Rhodomonas_salina.1
MPWVVLPIQTEQHSAPSGDQAQPCDQFPPIPTEQRSAQPGAPVGTRIGARQGDQLPQSPTEQRSALSGAPVGTGMGAGGLGIHARP